MMYKRLISLEKVLKTRSLFLLGPRQTGKSTLLRTRFPEARYVDLLEANTFRELSANPELLRERLRPEESLVIIDEIQKLPGLLDEVQLLIDRNPNLRFILTGSSARKLVRGRANLLGGRARTLKLFPLTSFELGFPNLNKMLNFGNLPGIYSSPDPWADLKSYVGTYLKEEIQAEGLTRKIENFSRFLHVAALCNSEQINYSEIGNDAQISPRTVSDHFQILQDTLIAEILPVFSKQTSRKTVTTPKFYFFDIGVAHALQGRKDVSEGTSEYGKALEHLVFMEVRAFLSYFDKDEPLSFWRTRSLEVDFIIGDSVAIEVKAKKHVTQKDCAGLNALFESFPKLRRIVVSQEQEKRISNKVEIYPIVEFFKELWAGKIV